MTATFTTTPSPVTTSAPAPASSPDTHAAPVKSAAGVGGWVLVIGASSAIGRAVAKKWASAGSDIIVAGRDLDDMTRSAADLRVRYGRKVEVVEFDALAFEKHESFWQECKIRAGGAVAGAILVHGQMPAQADTQANFAVARQAIDVNFTSVVSVLTHVANDFESARAGFICVFSSVAGDRGRQSNYTYGAAKAALTAYLQGLRNRLFKSGVHVTTVKPGFVDTAMTWGLPGLFLVATPEKVADDVHCAVRHGCSQIYTPWFWRYIMLIIKSVPEMIFKRMKM